MRLITYLPDAATIPQINQLLLLAGKAARYQKQMTEEEGTKDAILTQDIRVAGQLNYKAIAYVETTKTGYTVRTSVEDLL